MSARTYRAADLAGLLGMKGSTEETIQLVESIAAKVGLRGGSWSLDDAAEIFNRMAAEPGLHRVFARCALARLYADRKQRQDVGPPSATAPAGREPFGRRSVDKTRE